MATGYNVYYYYLPSNEYNSRDVAISHTCTAPLSVPQATILPSAFYYQMNRVMNNTIMQLL
jgi:hypothetical protein